MTHHFMINNMHIFMLTINSAIITKIHVMAKSSEKNIFYNFLSIKIILLFFYHTMFVFYQSGV